MAPVRRIAETLSAPIATLFAAPIKLCNAPTAARAMKPGPFAAEVALGP